MKMTFSAWLVLIIATFLSVALVTWVAGLCGGDTTTAFWVASVLHVFEVSNNLRKAKKYGVIQ